MRSQLSMPMQFEQIVAEHQAAVFRTLHRLTGAGAHIEDLAQDVFLRLFRALPEFRGEAQLSSYLYRITYNVAQDEWSRRKRDREHRAVAPPSFASEEDTWLETLHLPLSSAEHLQGPEQHFASEEVRAAVDACLAELSGPERAVLTLYYTEDLSYEAIAEVVCLPLNTVRTHLHRGRKRLSARVQQRLARPQRPTEEAPAGRAG